MCEGYPEYSGGCSVQSWDIMMHVGYYSTVGVFNNVEGFLNTVEGYLY